MRRRCVILNYIQLFPIFQHVFASTSHRIKTLQNIYKIAYYLKLSSERTFSILAICENALHKLWYLTAPNICATHSPLLWIVFFLISDPFDKVFCRKVSAKISASMSSPALLQRILQCVSKTMWKAVFLDSSFDRSLHFWLRESWALLVPHFRPHNSVGCH